MSLIVEPNNMTNINNTLLALIHNNNDQRNTYIRPKQAKLIEDCPQIRGPVIEVYFHGEQPHGSLMTLLREVLNLKINWEWTRYRQLKPIFLPWIFLGFVTSTIMKFCFSPAKLKKLKKLSAIEVVHSDQHVRAWTTFLQSDAEFLISFEDDAIFKEDSSQRIFDLINLLLKSKGSVPIFIDLAGGVKLNDLKIGKLESKHDANFRYYSKAVTNTACVYLMNRSLIKNFHSILAQRPWLRLLQVDFMMNKLFIIMEEMEITTECMHAEPSVFGHGSATGEYASSLDFGRYWHS